MNDGDEDDDKDGFGRTVIGLNSIRPRWKLKLLSIVMQSEPEPRRRRSNPMNWTAIIPIINGNVCLLQNDAGDFSYFVDNESRTTRKYIVEV